MKRWGVPAKFGTQEDIGERTIGSNLDEMVAEGAKRGDKVWVILVKGVVLENVYQEVAFNVFILGGPNLFSTFVDNCVLVRVVVSSGARQGGEEMREELCFWEDGEGKDAARRSRWGRRWDNGDRGSDNGWQEVLNGDVSKWDALDNLFETLVDVSVLWLQVGIFKLRTREIVLLGGDVGENLKEIGWGGNEDG